MHDIKALEEEWRRYRAKQKYPWYIVFFVLLLILITGVLYNKKLLHIPAVHFSFFKPATDLKHVKKDISKTLHMNSALSKLESIDAPSVPVMKNSENTTMKQQESLVDIPILDVDGTPKSEVSTSERRHKKIHLDIIETSNIVAYKDVEKRFLQSHDIDDALFLAKSYFKKGQYKKAEHWAYEANKLNADNIENLFIFIKAKVKQGNRNEAIAILQNYIKRTNSSEAQALLLKIENGTL